MRALIRAEIKGFCNKLPSRNDRTKYDHVLVELFKNIGYDAREWAGHLPTQDELEESADVNRLFESVPETIKNEELKHLVLLGYTSEGQAKFVVCSINQNILHIRVRDDLFDKLKRACKEICMGAWRHAAVSSFLMRRHRKEPNWDLFLSIRGPIEVMEPNHSHPTILGHLTRKPMRTLFKHQAGESILAVLAFSLSILLFLFTPDWAPIVTQILLPIKTFDQQYIQGLLERIYSALIVTFFITTLDLAVKYRDLYRNRPILWNAGIQPGKTDAG